MLIGSEDLVKSSHPAISDTVCQVKPFLIQMSLFFDLKDQPLFAFDDRNRDFELV